MRFYNESLQLYYEKKNDSITICEADHLIETANIPESIDGLPVTAIDKKAFLGCKIVKTIIVPDSIDSIGDFAFAMCDHLSTVSLPRKEIKLGQSIFKNDHSLTEIIIRDDIIDYHAAFLLSATPVIMVADYLIDILQCGSDEWYKMWDQKLLDILNRKDDEGYHLYVLCGEEDLHFDYDQYIEYNREKKAGLCIQRLLYNNKLPEKTAQMYIDYLNSHTSDTDPCPVFSHLISCHGDEEAFYDVLIRYEVITKQNRENLMRLLGDRHIQAKTFLINSFQDEGSDFFDDLML